MSLQLLFLGASEDDEEEGREEEEEAELFLHTWMEWVPDSEHLAHLGWTCRTERSPHSVGHH